MSVSKEKYKQRIYSSDNNNESDSQQKERSEIDDRRNQIKRKVFDNMQTDIRAHPEPQAQSYELLDNAKKLKKLLVNSLYQAREPLYNPSHFQNNSTNENAQKTDNISNVNGKLKNNDLTIKILKQTQQTVHSASKFRSSSLQKDQSAPPPKNYANMHSLIPPSQLPTNLNKNSCSQARRESCPKQTQVHSKNTLQKGVSSSQHQCYHKEGCQKDHKKDKSVEGDSQNDETYQQSEDNSDQNINGYDTLMHKNQLDLNVIHEKMNGYQNEGNRIQEKGGIFNLNEQLKNGERNDDDNERNEDNSNVTQAYSREEPQSAEKIRSLSGCGKQVHQLIENEEEKQEILKKIQNQKKEILESKKEQDVFSSPNVQSRAKQTRSFSTQGVKEQSLRNEKNVCDSVAVGFLSREQKIIDMQNLMQRIKVDNQSRLNRLEVKQLEEELEKEKLYEKQMLDLKHQQKHIFLLEQEKDLILDVKEQYEVKTKFLQNKTKNQEQFKMSLEEEIQRQFIQIQQLKNNIKCKEIEFSDLNKKNISIKKQYDSMEIEKNKAVILKIQAEQQAQDRYTQFQCLTQQNRDITIEFERKHKDQLYQINSLAERLKSTTLKYEEAYKNENIFEKKFKHEESAKQQLLVELKLIQAQVSVNEDMKKRLKQKEDKLDELEGVVDDLKRKIRNNLDLEMKYNPQRNMIQKIVEKPIFIEKKIDIGRGTEDHQLVIEYRQQLEKVQNELSELRKVRGAEQEQLHQKVLECETWKSHSFTLEDKHHAEVETIKVSFELERSHLLTDLRDTNILNNQLQHKVRSLVLEIEALTHNNIDKNKQIADSLLNSNTFIRIGESQSLLPNFLPSSQKINNNQIYIPYTPIFD